MMKRVLFAMTLVGAFVATYNVTTRYTTVGVGVVPKARACDPEEEEDYTDCGCDCCYDCNYWGSSCKACRD